MQEINKADLIEIRDYLPGDHNFILATWLRGLRYGNEWFSLIDSDAYYENYEKVIKAILTRPNTVVRVASLKDDPEVILGYSVYADDVLDWVFVKKAWRNIKIAKSLMPSTVKVVTHLTKTGVSMLKKYPEVRFNPFYF